MKNPLNLVSIGSISAARILAVGFRDQREHVTAIVPVTDTGSSTGVVRERFGMPAPGDVRAVLAALGDDENERSGLLKDLVQYRFSADRFPELGNIALGNLMLAALTEMTGSFSEGVKAAEKLLCVKGRVFPVTPANVQISAVLQDGTKVTGEKGVRRVGKAPIKEVLLENDDVPLEEGLAPAIEQADLILIGPGCLYTSVIACLVVPGLSRLLCLSKGKKVYCCNTTSTPGQTDGLTVLDHVAAITRYLDNVPPDYVLINNQRPRPEVVRAYMKECVVPLFPSDEEIKKIEALGSIPVLIDLIEENWGGKRKLHKVDTIRHDPQKVRDVLLKINYSES